MLEVVVQNHLHSFGFLNLKIKKRVHSSGASEDIKLDGKSEVLVNSPEKKKKIFY